MVFNNVSKRGRNSEVTRSIIHTIQQVIKASVDQYTGIGKPPSCEMMVTAASSESTPSALAMEVELIGPKPAKIMKLEQRAENVSIQAPPTSSCQAIRVPH